MHKCWQLRTKVSLHLSAQAGGLTLFLSSIPRRSRYDCADLYFFGVIVVVSLKFVYP